MKVLFLSDQLGKKVDANARIALVLAEALVQQGHEVTIAGFSDHAFEKREGNLSLRVFFSELYARSKLVYKSLFEKDLSPWSAAVRHPIVVMATLLRKWFRFDFRKILYRRIIERVAREESVDLCIAFVSPFFMAIALANADIAGRKGVYMLDPYHSHYEQKDGYALQEELTVLQNVEYFALPPLLYTEYHQHPAFAAQSEKLRRVDFPLSPLAGDFRTNLPNTSQRTLFYFGQFYPNIRSPEYLLRLLEALPENFILLLAGSLKFKPPSHLAHRVQILPPMSPKKLYETCSLADYLINIDNSVGNQVPSKIFELFALGLPILNLCLDECAPSLPYMKRYPCVLTIQTDRCSILQAAQKMLTFDASFHDTQLEYQKIEQIFYENTPAYIVTELLRANAKKGDRADVGSGVV